MKVSVAISANAWISPRYHLRMAARTAAGRATYAFRWRTPVARASCFTYSGSPASGDTTESVSLSGSQRTGNAKSFSATRSGIQRSTSRGISMRESLAVDTKWVRQRSATKRSKRFSSMAPVRSSASSMRSL